MRRELFICLLLAVITLGIYLPASRLGFLNYDDPDYVTNNPMVGGGLTSDSVWWALTSAHDGNWHPVTWWSHMLDCQLFGFNPAGHHWVNIGWHIVNTLLLFLVLRKMTGAWWRSALVAALFALHPMHVQSVAWITERKDVLSGFFMLLTLWAYTHHVQQQQNNAGGGVIEKATLSDFLLPSSRPLQLALLCFALGLMSKPMLVTLPAILLLLDFWPLKRLAGLDHPRQCFQSVACKKLLLEKIPFLALSLATVMATLSSQKGAGFVITTNMLPLSERLANVPVFYATYLGKLFWPENLAIFYPYHAIPLWEQAASLLLLVLLTVVCFRRLRSQPCWLVGWLWFLIMLIPVIGLVQVGGQSIADRYTYLPSIGLFIIVAWTLGELADRSTRWLAGAVVAGCAMVLACALDTQIQLRYWRSNTVLFSHALEVTGENATGCLGLGYSLWRDAGDLDGAATAFEAALRLESASKYQWEFNALMAHHNLGLILLLSGKPAKAEVQLRAALQLDPQIAFTHKYLGDALNDQGKSSEAEAEYVTSTQLAPENVLLAHQVEASRKLMQLRETLKTSPTMEIHVQIAELQSDLGVYQSAAGHYRAALQLKPDAPEILNNLAWLMATCPDQKVRDGAQAVKYAQHACELTGWKDTIYIGTLAAAYAEAGKFEDAIGTAQRACDVAAKNGETDLENRNQELMKLYRAHKPVRE